MSVNKDPSKNGQWLVSVRYQDYTGKTKQKCKRGFKTKREGAEWEREFLKQSKTSLDMTFKSFVEIYKEDTEHRVKQNTWKTKEIIIENKLMPYFKDKKMNEIKPSDIIKWQNAMMDKPMSYYMYEILYWTGIRYCTIKRNYVYPGNRARSSFFY